VLGFGGGRGLGWFPHLHIYKMSNTLLLLLLSTFQNNISRLNKFNFYLLKNLNINVKRDIRSSLTRN
jgi:hypothetical protein